VQGFNVEEQAGVGVAAGLPDPPKRLQPAVASATISRTGRRIRRLGTGPSCLTVPYPPVPAALTGAPCASGFPRRRRHVSTLTIGLAQPGEVALVLAG